MKLATVRTGELTTTVRIVDDQSAVDLGVADVGELLADPHWRQLAEADGASVSLDEVSYAPLVSHPGKIVCVGLNYRDHIIETGREVPTHPTIFLKLAETLIGAHDDIVLPPESEAVDWEAELAVVIGSEVRRASTDEAEQAIAGFGVLNDVSMRDWQRRTLMWDQGKNFERSCPVGPWLVTPEDLPGGVRPRLDIRCQVNGTERQSDTTGDLVFDPVDLVRYVSTIVTLKPGDIIATGTPGGVGMATGEYLGDGDVLTTEIAGLGRCINRAVAEELPR